MIRIELPQGGVPSWLIFVGLIYAIFWIWSLVAVLSDKREGKDVEKLIWVVVLIWLPVLGLILYAFLGPGAQTDMSEAAKRKAMFDHIGFCVRSAEQSIPFFEACLGPLGLKIIQRQPDSAYSCTFLRSAIVRG